MLKFGTVVSYSNNYYIYLAEKGDDYTYYFAKIITDNDQIKLLLQKKDNYKEAPHNPARNNAISLITCFVTLTSEDFEGNLAFLARPDGHGVNISEYLTIIGSLNDPDTENLKKEILSNPQVLPPPLIKKVQALQ